MQSTQANITGEACLIFDRAAQKETGEQVAWMLTAGQAMQQG